MVEPLDLDSLYVDVLAFVIAVDEESFRLLDKLLSCDVFLVISHELCLRLGSSSRRGIPQWCGGPCLQESDREELKFSLDDIEPALLCCCLCWISAIWYAYSLFRLFLRLSKFLSLRWKIRRQNWPKLNQWFSLYGSLNTGSR